MNILDIILLIPLIYAVYAGFKEGFVAQLGGLAAIVIGVWLAIHFSADVGKWLGINPDYATVVAFILIILAALLFIGVMGWLLGKIFNFVGLGMFNKIGGVLISMVKMVFILSVLLMAFDVLNKKTELVEQKHFDNSALYGPISSLSTYIFPSLEYITNAFKKEV